MLRLCGPAVKTQPSHGCYWGSIPHRVTKPWIRAHLASFFHVSDFVTYNEYAPRLSHLKVPNLQPFFKVCTCSTFTSLFFYYQGINPQCVCSLRSHPLPAARDCPPCGFPFGNRCIRFAHAPRLRPCFFIIGESTYIRRKKKPCGFLCFLLL